MADPSSNYFYPFSILLRHLPINHYFSVLLAIHLFLAGLFVYLYCRTIRLDKFASTLAGVVYMFGTFFISKVYAGHWTAIESLVWLPAILACYEMSHISRHWSLWIILGSICMALLWLSGHPQFILYSLYFSLFYYIYKVYQEKKFIKSSIKFLKPLLSFPVIILLGTGLAAMQLIPTLELVHNTSRSAGVVSYNQYLEFASQNSFPPMHLITFLYPQFFGFPSDPNYVSEPYFWEASPYLSVIALIFVFLAILKSWRKSYLVSFYILTIIITLMISFGNYYGLGFIFYNFLPGFKLFRIPAKILFLTTFGLSVLAGTGISYFDREPDRNIKLILYPLFRFTMMILFISVGFAIFDRVLSRAMFQNIPLDQIKGVKFTNQIFLLLFGLFLFLFIVYKRSHSQITYKSFALFSMGLILLQLWTYNQKMVNKEYLDDKYFNSSDVTSFLKSQTGLFRIAEMGSYHLLDQSVLHGIQDVNGYNPIILSNYKNFSYDKSNSSTWPERTPSNPEMHVFLDYLNVKYYVTDTPFTANVNLDGYIPNYPEEVTYNHQNYDLQLDDVLFSANDTAVFPLFSPSSFNKLELMSQLNFAQDIPNGALIANIKVVDIDSNTTEFHVRAGIETAESAYDEITASKYPVPHDKPETCINIAKRSVYYSAFKFNHATRLKSVIVEDIYPNPKIKFLILEIHVMDDKGDYLAVNSLNLKRVYNDGINKVYENMSCLPRAYFVNHVIPCNSANTARELIFAEKSDPRTTAFAESLEQYSFPTLSNEEINQSSIVIRKYEPDELNISTSCPKSGFMVLSEMYYPGWKAFIDGKRTSIYKTNYTFRGIIIPSGKHLIKFVFEPQSLEWGKWISIICILSCLLIFVLGIFVKF